MQHSEADELARARLALVSAGHPALGAPRRAAPEPSALPGPDDSPAAEAAPEGQELAAPVSGVRRLGLERWWRVLPRGITIRHLVVVVALLLCGVGVALTALARSAATEVPLRPESLAPSVSVASAAPSASPTELLRVHVIGAVASPGVVQLPGGTIVQDAVEAAGGLTADADPATLNFAAPLADGMQIVIGTADQPIGEVNNQGATPGAGAGPTVLDLNSATAAELEELPGIGPVTAAAIVEWRDSKGPFTAVEELQEIEGIGPKTFAKLRERVRV